MVEEKDQINLSDTDNSERNDPANSKPENSDGGINDKGDSCDPVVEKGDQDKITTSESEETEEKEWVDILGSGHIKKKVITPGEGDNRPIRGDICTVDIVGTFDDGTVFEDLKNVEVTLGDADVVQGLDYTLPLMHVGETSEVVITSRFGYGSLGDPPKIPPDATLHYVVTLHSHREDPDVHSMSLDEKLAIGSKKKERGNWWFARKEYQLAIQCYRKALTYLDEDASGECSLEIIDTRLKTYNNLTIAQINIEAYDAALASVNNVLALEPHNIKAIFRKVKILKSKGEFEEAILIARQGMKSKPDASALQEELNILLEMKKKSVSAQKVLYRKMFQNQDNSKNKKSGAKLTFALKLFGILSFAVGIISAVAMKYKT